MDECVGVNGRQHLCLWIVIWKSENMCYWCNVLFLFQNTFYVGSCNFCNGLIKLSCISCKNEMKKIGGLF